MKSRRVHGLLTYLVINVSVCTSSVVEFYGFIYQNVLFKHIFFTHKVEMNQFVCRDPMTLEDGHVLVVSLP